jgi:hypothetical protein
MAAIANELRREGRVVLTGSEGIGKSSIAAELAYLERGRYSLVWWVDCTEQTLATGLAELARRLGFGGDGMADMECAYAVLRFLHAHSRWLLIIDHVSRNSGIASLIPKSSSGHTIITSRDADWSGVAASLCIEALEPSIGRALLYRGEDERLARLSYGVAAFLEGHPATIDQAATLISGGRITLEQLHAMLSETAVSPGLKVETLRCPQALLWRIALQLYSSTRADSMRYVLPLLFCAGQQPVSPAIIRTMLEVCQDGEETAATEGGLAEDLIAFGIATTSKAGSLSLPLFAHESGLRSIDEMRIKEYANIIVNTLLKCNDRDSLSSELMPSNTVEGRQVPEYDKIDTIDLMAHCRSAMRHTRGLGIDATSLCRLMLQVAAGELSLGRPRETRDTIAGCMDLLGTDGGTEKLNALLAEALNLQGVICHVLGEFHQGLESLERAYELKVSLYGARDLEVVTPLSNLGCLRRESGDYEGAMIAFREALSIVDERHGANHSASANILVELSQVEAEIGSREEAIRLLDRALQAVQNLDTFLSIKARILMQLAVMHRASGEMDRV